MSFCGDYAPGTFGGWDGHARKVVAKLKAKTNRAKYDFIVCQGLSGQSIGFIVAYELGVPLLILRKTAGEEFSKRQAPGKKEGLLEGAQYLKTWMRNNPGKTPRVCFVDDCVSSGHTRKRCGVAVHKAGGVVSCQATYDGFVTLPEHTVKSFESGSMTAKNANYV